jgi:hypothetical protein
MSGQIQSRVCAKCYKNNIPLCMVSTYKLRPVSVGKVQFSYTGCFQFGVLLLVVLWCDSPAIWRVGNLVGYCGATGPH